MCIRDSYNFGPNSKTAPVIRFSGAYCVNTVINTFEGGQFTQTIHAFRRPDQESDITATPEELADADPVIDPGNATGSELESVDTGQDTTSE